MSVRTVDARLSRNKRGESVVTVPFLTASLSGKLFRDMVRVVDCHSGVLGSNPGGPKDFSLWNCFDYSLLSSNVSYARPIPLGAFVTLL